MAETVSLLIEEQIPVVAECDVLVVGGGPGGLGAAVMAARAGANTVLAERYGMLGGMASVGEVNPFMPNHYSKGDDTERICMDRPIYMEWAKAIAAYLPPDLREQALADREVCGVGRRIDKSAAALAAEDLCLQAGVRLLYHHTLVQAPVRDDRIDRAVFHSKSGFDAVKAKVYVDSTGDGDLALLAGCDSDMGDADGDCQPMTLCFKLSHVDRSKMPDRPELQSLYEKAKDEGRMDCPRENILFFGMPEASVVHFNTTRVIGKSGVDGVSLTEAEIEGRRQFRQYLGWLRDCVPGFENAQIHSIASHIGIRETRRIQGRAYLTRRHFETAAKFDDAIARCNYPIDIHNPRGSGTELTRIPHSDYYEIPYGCIVARDVTNLAIGSRCISVDHAVHSSMRVMPPVCSVGQAAGLAAAHAVRTGVDIGDLDGRTVRAELKKHGAWL